jgi:hypothetical protein
MRKVTWVDEDGYKRQSWIKDNAPDSDAPKGTPDNPPDINSLDWDSIKRDVHNALVERGLTSWDKLQANQQINLTNVIAAVIKKYLVAAYRS